MESGKVHLGIIILIAVAGLAVGILLFNRQSPIGHVFHRDSSPFAERLAEPPSFVYGSSIHVWAYDADGAVQEIAVTGHADSNTCRVMTGLVFNAYLQKQDRQGDMFVAGAARLEVGEIPSAAANDPALMKYEELFAGKTFTELLLRSAKAVAIEGSEAQSSVQFLEQKLKEYTRQLEDLEKDPQIARKLGPIKSRRALSQFVQETVNVANDSGLVVLHRVPATVAATVRKRIYDAAKTDTATTVRFDDLLSPDTLPEAVVLANMLRTGSGGPLVVRVPLSKLSVEGFEEAKRLNRDDVESSMVGDAERRRTFYQERLAEIEKQEMSCAKASPNERRRPIELDQVCTADGYCYQPQSGEKTTYGEYCDNQIPLNKKIVDGWQKGIGDLLQSIQADRARPGDGRIDAINHATLVDSMLRDWQLPVSRAQEAFDIWRQQQRRPAWANIDAELKRAGVDRTALNGEQLVFSVRVVGKDLEIHPIHVIDLARAVLAIEPTTGVTRIIDAWGERTPVKPATGVAPKQMAEDLASQAITAAKSGDTKTGEQRLMRAVSLHPAAAFRRVEKEWLALFRDDTAHRGLLVSKVQAASVVRQRMETLDELLTSADLKDKPEEYVKRLAALLDADPGMPVDFHMRLVISIAQFIALHTEMLVKEGYASGPTYEAWDIVELAIPRVPKQSAGSDALKKAERLLSRVLEIEDPVARIHQSLEKVHSRAPEYLKQAMAARDMPTEPSREMLEYTHPTEMLLVEREAVELDGVQGRLTRRAHAEKAVEMLWANLQPDLVKVRDELSRASIKGDGATGPAFKSATDRLTSFIDTGNSPDTIARVEIGQTVSNGATALLVWSAGRLKEGPIQYATMLSTHDRLWARVDFEQDQYARAYDRLFTAVMPVALYHPQLNWSNANVPLPQESDARVAQFMAATPERGLIVVTARVNGQIQEVMRFNGLSAGDADTLAERINRNLFHAPIGHLYEQVLVTRVPMRTEAENVRRLLATDRVRLALLKAMVFADSPPAVDLIPTLRAPAELTASDIVESYRVPTLKDLAQEAQAHVKKTARQ
jgi:hypothetical protein